MYCFDKSRRLLNHADYDSVFQHPKKYPTLYFLVLYRRNTVGHARLGLALSKKMIAKAHDRNRLKRLLRESFRTTTLPDVDVIFLARKGVHRAENKQITDALGSIWNKLCEK